MQAIADQGQLTLPDEEMKPVALQSLESFNKGSLSSRAYQSIRLGLMRGNFAPGEKLLLRPLADQLGVSITPIRDALLQLVSEQALMILSDRSVAVPSMDLTRLREIRDLRVDLEGKAIEAAVPNLTDADIQQATVLMKQLYDAKARAEGGTAMTVRHEFHFHLYRAAGRPVLTSTIENLWVQAGPLVHEELSAPTLLRDAESTGLLRALRRRDALMTRIALQFSILEMFERVEAGLEKGRSQQVRADP